MTTIHQQRFIWTFPYSATDLATAAAEKVKHHAERLEFWTKARTKVLDDIKEKGLVIETPLAKRAMSDTYNATRRQTTVSVDDAMERDLDEAHIKVTEHEQKLKDYTGWQQVMEAQATKTPMPNFDLTHNDWLFFFGR